MCAVLGAVNFQTLDLHRFSQSLLHRGPDEQKHYTQDNVFLGHNRLSIVDINHGQEPFFYQDFAFIFNGEIYNHLELRTQLQEFSFNSNCDGETFFYLLLKFGDQAFAMVDGMFAACLLDNKNKTLKLMRDRIGKKPLYYYQDNERFIFASELKGLKAVLSLSPNEKNIAHFLRTGLFLAPYSAYHNVFSLEPGTVLELNTRTLSSSKRSYFNLEECFLQNTKLNFQEALQSLEMILKQSVKNRLLSSDLEVGVFLSGGIDSGLVTAIASEFTDSLKTFTVRFKGSFDESDLAKQVAKKYNTKHEILEINSNIQDDILKILLQYDQPFIDDSAIPSFYVSLFASKHLTVVLNGDGADELFAGYRRYMPFRYDFNRLKFLSILLPLLPKPKDKISILSYCYRLLKLLSKKDIITQYLSAGVDIFEDFEDHLIIREVNALQNLLTNHRKLNLSPLNTMLLNDMKSILPSILLTKMDIATMSHSIEARSPFLSKDMLNFACTLSDSFKIRNFQGKFILRQLAKKYLPKEIICAPKRGFELPLIQYVEHDLKDIIFTYLTNSSYFANYINKDFVSKVLNNEIVVDRQKRAKMLWSLFCLEVWSQHNF